MLAEYIPLVWLFGLCGAVVASIMVATTLLGPSPDDLEEADGGPTPKSQAFECGSEPIGQARQRFSVKFYLVAISFIVFDVEAVFVIPWAVVFRDLGWYGFWTMLVFLVVLTLGLVYEWKSGGLEWD
ncbi:MAG: NADH-quinone oxidoreductase subunit A [Myxococcales bacterium]|nr:NADH-quinone oxidoreductase subunit A [Myxococcales bacterium]